ncbi:uncharacterized protein LOC114525397 isoform X2 [Dendronephthya gigantea]|nr:uncharacterized protein LOC114525397 isoform X2 [Dendronephthya gigantea]
MSNVSKEANKPVQALLNAVATSKLRLVRLLVEGGVHVDSRNDHGQTPLLITCLSSHNTCHIRGETREKVVKYLISAGADVNAKDETGRTPLIYAVIMRACVIFDLINAGADPWLEDSSHKCAFDYALQQRDLVQAKTIVEACKRKMREMARDFGKMEDKTMWTMRDVERTPSINPVQENIQDVSIGKPEKKLGKKNKSETNKKSKVSSKIRKRPSRNTSSPSLVTIGKKSPTEHQRKYSGPPQVNSINPHNENVEILFQKPPILFTTTDCATQENTSKISQSKNVIQIHEDAQLCGLCKTIFGTQYENEAEILDLSENLNFQESEFTGLLYRRRSTGSLFGLTRKRYEAIRKKRELGITIDDTDLPMVDTNPLFVKSSQTSTLVDISANELLVPDRARSLSVCLPPLEGTRSHLEEDERKDMISATSVPELRTMAWSQAGRMVLDSRVYLRNEGDDDDIIIIPSSSQDDITTPYQEHGSSSAACDKNGHLETCNSPIPTIVLTDYVKVDQK